MNSSVCWWSEPPGASAPKRRASRAQTLQPDRSRDVQKYHQIETRYDGIAPAVKGAAQHPVRSIQENLAHEPETIGDFANFAIRRIRRPPEVIVRIVMRNRERIGQRAAEARDTGAGSSSDHDAAGLHLAAFEIAQDVKPELQLFAEP